MAARQVTVFGGTGFIGRHLVPALVEGGWSVRVASRRPRAAELPSPGQGTQVALVEADVGDTAAVREAVDGSGAVVNLVGTLTAPPAALWALHRDAAARIAHAATRAGAGALVHVSALGVAADAPSVADRSKAAGEEAVRAAYPGAALVRPSLVFGTDDHFFNRIAALARRVPLVPLPGPGDTPVQPVAVDDVAAAIRRILEDAALRPGLYELGGPEVESLRRLVERTIAAAGSQARVLPLPSALARGLGTLLALLPRAPFTADQAALLRTPKVVAEGAAGLQALGIEARPLAERLAGLQPPARPGHPDSPRRAE